MRCFRTFRSSNLAPGRLQSWYYLDVLTPSASPEVRVAALGFATIKDFQNSFAWFDLRTDGNVDGDTERAITKVESSGGRLSPRFRITQFRSKATGKVIAHRELLRALEALRDRLGEDIRINHGFRAPEDEARLIAQGFDPRPLSQHKWGMAVDVNRIDFRIVRDLGMFSGIGCKGSIGGPVIHVDVRHAGEHNVTKSSPEDPEIWVYA